MKNDKNHLYFYKFSVSRRRRARLRYKLFPFLIYCIELGKTYTMQMKSGQKQPVEVPGFRWHITFTSIWISFTRKGNNRFLKAQNRDVN